MNREYTLVTYSTGDTMVAEVLQDWLEFLGSRPREILFAVSSREHMPPVYADLVLRGLIDRIVEIPLAGRSVQQADPDAIRHVIEASHTKWILLIKLDTLPYRRGHDDWLSHAFVLIDRHKLFGLTGGNLMTDTRPLDVGYSTTRKCYNNFCLFRRAEWLTILRGILGDSWDSPFAGNPIFHGDGRRFATEAAIETYLRNSGQSMLVRHDSTDWSVFHVNVWGDRLRVVRDAYLRRYRIRPYLNTGRPYTGDVPYPWKLYYLHPRPPLFKRLRIWFGLFRRRLFSKTDGSRRHHHVD